METRNLIRIIYFTLILVALIWVGLKAGGDPCEKCQLELKDGDVLDCREIVKRFVEPILVVDPTQADFDVSSEIPKNHSQKYETQNYDNPEESES